MLLKNNQLQRCIAKALQSLEKVRECGGRHSGPNRKKPQCQAKQAFIEKEIAELKQQRENVREHFHQNP